MISYQKDLNFDFFWRSNFLARVLKNVGPDFLQQSAVASLQCSVGAISYVMFCYTWYLYYIAPSD